MFTGWVTDYVGIGIACAMPFDALPDTVYYCKFKTGNRAAGIPLVLETSFCISCGKGTGALVFYVIVYVAKPF